MPIESAKCTQQYRALVIALKNMELVLEGFHGTRVGRSVSWKVYSDLWILHRRRSYCILWR